MISTHIRRAMTMLAVPAALFAQQPAPLPSKYVARPTTAAITTRDLMSRLYVFADDSMMGRETGTTGHVTSTAYLARELRRIGLRPAGDNGTYFQNLPMIRRAFDPASTITVDGTVLRGGKDFLAQSQGNMRSIDRAQVIYGGTALDTLNLLTPDQLRGKLIVLRPPAIPMGFQQLQQMQQSEAYRQYARALNAALAVVTVVDSLNPAQVRQLTQPREGAVMMKPADSAAASLSIAITRRAAETLIGSPLDSATKGQTGKLVSANIVFRDDPAPARNVVAVLPGSDPSLRGQYVALGAHSDHVGYATGRPLDHDSLHLANQARYAIIGSTPAPQRTPEQRAAVDAIRINVDSVRALRPPRLDSIRNGADDDGSGSVMLLELAEAFAKAPEKPKRSLVFVWHAGEEKGLLGARWFVEHATVPRDSIVAQLNMDMIGRGGAKDIPGGGPTYLQLVGSRRLSTELGDLVETVNEAQKQPFTFDYQLDANGHPERIYCRSDHYHYARWGIPVVFFTTGLHGDYHQVTDEPQYIDYDHLARVGRLVHDVALRVANLDHRVVVDQERPDPNGSCRQ